MTFPVRTSGQKPSAAETRGAMGAAAVQVRDSSQQAPDSKLDEPRIDARDLHFL